MKIDIRDVHRRTAAARVLARLPLPHDKQLDVGRTPRRWSPAAPQDDHHVRRRPRWSVAPTLLAAPLAGSRAPAGRPPYRMRC